MEHDTSKSQNQTNIHFNRNHFISSTVHINPKVLKNRTIHINPNTFKGVRPNSVHFNPKLIGNLNLNNLGTSQCQTEESLIRNNNLLIDNPPNKIDSQLFASTNQSNTNSTDYFHNPLKIPSNVVHINPNFHKLNTPISKPFLSTNNIQVAPNYTKQINLENCKQSTFTQVLTCKKEPNPLISLSKTKLIRKENTIVKKVLPLSKNSNSLISPLISISKTKLVRKQLTPNTKRTSVSKKNQTNSLVSISKMKLIRKNVSNQKLNNNEEKSTKILKNVLVQKILNKPNCDTSLIAVSRNKLIRKTQTPKKNKISRKSIGPRKSLTNKNSPSQYKLVRTSAKKSTFANSKLLNTFKLDNRNIQSKHQGLKRDSCIRKQSQSIAELNKNTTILKARAVVRNARKVANYPKTEGLVWMRNGAKLLPVCRYFLAGCCVKDSCPYLHVKHSIKAPICLAFLRGQCAQEEQCIRRHVLICPRWDRYGSCTVGKKCKWPHIRRKSTKNITKTEEKKLKKNSLPKSIPQNNKNDKKYNKDIKENVEEKQETKRYYEQECKVQNENIVIKDQQNISHSESPVENDSETEDNHILSKRPKIGILPAFIPFS